MFEEKVELIIPKERKVLNKVFGGKKVNVYETLTQQEILLCLSNSLSAYNTSTFMEDGDIFVTPVELYANVDITLAQLCTNIDMTNFSFDDYCAVGLHEFLKNNVKGYDIIEQSVRIGVQHIHTIKMLEGLDHVATIDELEQTEGNVRDMLDNGIPENVRDLVMAKIADDPSIGKFYEEFNKAILGDEADGLNE